MRIKAGNQLSQEAQTLDFGSGYSLVEAAGDVTLANGGSQTFVAAPTGVAATDTTAIHAARDAAGANGRLIFASGTYVVTGVLASVAGQKWDLHPGTVIKLADSTADTANELYAVKVTADDVELTGGTVDFNRANQDKTGYNAAGGANIKTWNGVRVVGSSGTHLNRVKVFTTVINSADFGVHVLYADRARLNVTVRASGAGVWVDLCDDALVERVDLDSLDNSGWKVFPHALDVYFANRPTINNVRITNHFGNGSIAGGTALSDSISGVTMTGVNDATGTNWHVRCSTDPTTNLGVGTSFLDCVRARISNVEVEYYRTVLAEFGSCIDGAFTNWTVDGHYNDSAANSNVQDGVAVYNNGYYSNFLHRTMRFTERCKFVNFTVRRCSDYGLGLLAARNCMFIGFTARACRRGLQSQLIYTNTSDNFASEPVRDLINHAFIGCDFSFNELQGIDLTDLRDSKFLGCVSHNNGQANAYPTGARRSGTTVTDSSGVHSATGTGSRQKIGLEFVSLDAQDTQTWTDSVSVATGTPTIASVSNEGNYFVGQTIKLVAAGAAAADLFTRITEVDKDEITLADPVQTFTSVAGTGTLSTVGAAITGSGTAFNSELQGRYWITAGGNTRQINKVADNTHATLDVAFPSNLSGQAFTITKITSAGVPCQKYGISLDVSMLAPQIVGGNITGNTTQDVRDQTASATPAAIIRRNRVEGANALLGWYAECYPLGGVNGGVALVAQALRATKIGLSKGDVVTNVIADVTVAASGTAGVVNVGLYDSSYNKLASSGDVQASFTSTGLKALALSAPFTITADGLYYLVIDMTTAYGTTQPTIGANNATGASTPLSGKPRHNWLQSAQASLPTTATPGDSSAMPWFAVS